MNKKDELIQKHFPTVMVPKHGELESCGLRQTRLLMGQGGLYIETRQPWGHLIEKLWESPRPLPYGKVDEVDTFEDAFSECLDHLRGLLPEAEGYAADDLEWAAWIIHDEHDGNFTPVRLRDLYRSAVRIRSNLPVLNYDQSLVVDVHSHGRLAPGFSATDDEDDKGGVRICVVLGDYGGPGTFRAEARYAVEGFFFRRDLS